MRSKELYVYCNNCSKKTRQVWIKKLYRCKEFSMIETRCLVCVKTNKHIEENEVEDEQEEK